MLKNKINKIKKLSIFLSILAIVAAGIFYFAHHYVSAYCLHQKQLTDSIAKVDSIVSLESVTKASALLDSIEQLDVQARRVTRLFLVADALAKEVE